MRFVVALDVEKSVLGARVFVHGTVEVVRDVDGACESVGELELEDAVGDGVNGGELWCEAEHHRSGSIV